MTSYEHRVLYYGPKSFEETEKSVAELHPIPSELNPIQEVEEFKEIGHQQNIGLCYRLRYETSRNINGS